MGIRLKILLLSLAYFAGAATALADCGQAYFPPLRHKGIEFGHYTSRFAAPIGGAEQTNCAILANDGTITQNGISGSFRFASDSGDYTIRKATSATLAGGVAVNCLVQPNGQTPNSVAFMEPVGGTLQPGEYTLPCCFVHEAQPPSSRLCEDVPGEGDLTSVVVEDGFGQLGLVVEITGTPQAPACGLIGLEVLLVAWPLARTLRPRRRRPARGARLVVVSCGAALLALLTASLPATPARAETVAIGANTDVSLTLIAYTHASVPVTLGGSGEVIVKFKQGELSTIEFDGGSIQVPTTTVDAEFLALVDVEATITAAVANLQSGAIQIANDGTFDASLVNVAVDTGTLHVEGPVFDEDVLSDRDFGNFPLVLDNQPIVQGLVTATPAPGGGYDLVVRLPLNFGVPVSTQTGAPWFGVEVGLLELAGPIAGSPDVSLPGLASWGLVGLALTLSGTAMAMLQRSRSRPALR